ncbi:hypothetical protein NLI96_g761 [Meripilus lineatus]|uniref:Magnesium transporter n=1 Tax=Meripilus lineatus TaxID=2056292 RepID=A0AAD5YNM0_9APHY|nr:hypothetical protein NLI96_g761 [Physisporinus lineatus]
MIGNLLIVIAILAILHAAYSTYEHLSYLKALGRPEGSIPNDIIIEAFISLILGTIGATVRTPELREITWRSEMKRRYASPLTRNILFLRILQQTNSLLLFRRAQEELDPRLSFKLFAQRAGLLSVDPPSKEQAPSSNKQ